MKTYTAQDYIFNEFGLSMPEGNIPGTWFSDNDLPMVVTCNCCGMTMALPTAMISEEGYTYCKDCA